MKRITQYWIGITLVVLLALAAAASAQGGFTLSRSTVDNGGGTLNSGGFTLTGAIGQPEAGFALSSGSFTLVGGAFAGGAAALAPEIDLQFYGQSFPNGYNYIDFESVSVGGAPINHTFTISNSGNADLLLTGMPAVTLTTGTHFTVTVQPASPVISNTTTTFDVTFDPAAAGSFTDTVTIANNDADENPFTFVIAGTGTVTPPTVTTDAATAVGYNDIRRQTGGRRTRWPQLLDKNDGIIDAEQGKVMLADTVDVYAQQNDDPGNIIPDQTTANRGSANTICAMYDQDPRYFFSSQTGVWPDPYTPAGSLDGKVTTSEWAKEMKMEALWGRANGEPFYVDEFLKKHPQWNWQKERLEDRPRQKWTTFRAENYREEK